MLPGSVGFHRLAEELLREDDVTSTKMRAAQIAAGMLIFAAGAAAGSQHAKSVAGQNHFGQPKTVLHVVVYKFKDATSTMIAKTPSTASRTWPEKFPA